MSIPCSWRLLELLLGLDLRVGEGRERAIQERRVRRAHPAVDVDQREDVLRVRIDRVEGGGRCRDGAERRPALRQLEDAVDPQVEHLLVRREHVERRADDEVVLLREGVADDGSRLAEALERRLRAVLPGQLQHLRDARIDRGHVELVPELLAPAGANPGDGRHLRQLSERHDRGDVGRGEPVLRGQRVVGVELLRDRVLERRLEPGREHGDEGDEREADHQRGGRERSAARVALHVSLGEAVRGAIAHDRGNAGRFRNGRATSQKSSVSG